MDPVREDPHTRVGTHALFNGVGGHFQRCGSRSTRRASACRHVWRRVDGEVLSLARDPALRPRPRGERHSRPRRRHAAPPYRIDTVELDFNIDEDETVVDDHARHPPRRRAPPTARRGVVPIGGSAAACAPSRSTAPRGSRARTYELGEDTPTLLEISGGRLQDRSSRRPSPQAAGEALDAVQVADVTQCEARGFRRITYFQDRPDAILHGAPLCASRPTRPSTARCSPTQRAGPAASWSPGGRHYAKFEPARPSRRTSSRWWRATWPGSRSRSRPARRVCAPRSGRSRRTSRVRLGDQSLKDRWHGTRGSRRTTSTRTTSSRRDERAGRDGEQGAQRLRRRACWPSRAPPPTPTSSACSRVMAHEYFHNWSGNRVTCRDWFQLTLKDRHPAATSTSPQT